MKVKIFIEKSQKGVTFGIISNITCHECRRENSLCVVTCTHENHSCFYDDSLLSYGICIQCFRSENIVENRNYSYIAPKDKELLDEWLKTVNPIELLETEQ